jgi:hypothetical protein
MKSALRTLIRLVLLEYVDDDPRSYVGKKGVVYHFKSGTPKADILEPAIFDMISKSYEPIGGHAKLSSRADVGDEYPEWEVADVDNDPEPDVVVVGQHADSGGIKIGASGTDGSAIAKSFMNYMKKNLLSDGGWWGEVSGAPAHVAINKLQIPAVTDKDKVEQLLGKKVRWHGKHPDGKFPGVDGWYSRTIGDHEHVKIIVGDVP